MAIRGLDSNHYRFRFRIPSGRHHELDRDLAAERLAYFKRNGRQLQWRCGRNRDLWELLLWVILELSRMGLEVRFWLILHELNAEAHAEARMAAEVLKEDEYFCRMPYAGEIRL